MGRIGWLWEGRLREGKVAGWIGSGRVKQRDLIACYLFLMPSGHWGETSWKATRPRPGKLEWFVIIMINRGLVNKSKTEIFSYCQS